MKALLLREIKSFFGSVTGYLVMAVFLLLTGLFLFVFEGDFNILNSGYNDLTPFFTLAPWILIFLIPAVTMRSFSDERKQGTLELLLTKPLSLWQIVLGKFSGAWVLIVLTIVPTLIYIYVLNNLGYPPGNIDWGSTLGAYIGLLFLITAYASIGIFTSTLSENQIVAFILSVVLCFTFYFGFEGLSQLSQNQNHFIASLGMESHYRSMSRGVLDTRDLLYFISVAFLFLFATVLRLKTLNWVGSTKWKTFAKLPVVLLVALLLNWFGQSIFKRWDLTEDKRYTLSEATLDILNQIDSPLFIDVFLEGKFPAEIKRLQAETRQLLEEFRAYNSDIQFQFINPIEESDDSDNIIDGFFSRGMPPMQVTVEERGKQTQEMVFPWAVAYSGNRDTQISLIKNKVMGSGSESVMNSIQRLEFVFAEAFQKVLYDKSKKIAVLKGNGQPQDVYLGDALLTLRENYFIAPFTLDSVASNPEKTLQQLFDYDLALMVKPTEPFSDAEKLVLDQYIMKGGKMIWMVDMVNIEMDSLYNETGSTLAFPRDLQLQDMFFKYGFRINPALVKDIMATPIALASGESGSATQYTQYPWMYAPMIYSNSNHPIVHNLEGVKMDFVNPIDTLKNNIKKTVLLQSSEYSKSVGTPIEVSLEMVLERPEPEEFLGKGNLPVAVLLEGHFTSAFQNRVMPFKTRWIESSPYNQMLVISDGDIIKNQLDRNMQPLELGFDKWTNKFYANKDLLLNAVQYMLDDSGLINIKSKEIRIPLLDKEKVYEHYTRAQWITIGLPLVLLMVFGLVFLWLRKRIYGR
ncbi:MAG: gliding motility-associated ABC transporter substrate-binding protein GldG [Flavobacterium sp.]